MVAARQESKKKPRTYADYREMLKEKDLDIVLVATPDHWHALPMIAAVEAGADVYVQKPISVDVVEGQAMLAAARKHKRVVQVGTQRRSTPHLIEARDRIIKRGQARQGRPRRDLLLLPHAAPARTRPTPRPPRDLDYEMWTGPAPMRPYNRWSIRAAGAPSWSTATASWATCASTCSTWSAGCSIWAGRSGSRSSGGILVDKGSKAEHLRHPDRHVRFRRPAGRLAASHLGRPARSRSIPGARPSTATRARSRPACRATTSRPHGRRQADARGRDVRARQVSRGPDREGPGAARRPGHPRPHAGLAARASTRRGKPVADIEQGYISTAACILANISMKLGRPSTWDHARGQVVGDDEANRLLARPYRAPWTHPSADAI